MRLMHISDLHLGKRVNEYSMLDDQAYILDEILRIAKEEEVQGVLIAGDVYDRPVPPIRCGEDSGRPAGSVCGPECSGLFHKRKP